MANYKEDYEEIARYIEETYNNLEIVKIEDIVDIIKAKEDES